MNRAQNNYDNTQETGNADGVIENQEVERDELDIDDKDVNKAF